MIIIYDVKKLIFKKFNIVRLIKRDGGIGPMKSQQPALQRYGANSNRLTCLKDKKNAVG